MNPVDPSTLTSLPSIVSTSRLTPYVASCNGAADEAIRLYSWNIEAGAAILGASAALEVGVRNAMHRELTTGWGQEDWWNAAPLAVKEIDQISEVCGYLTRRRGAGAWFAGHVVAELKASFWEGLLANRYHQALWVPALQHAFPTYQGRRGDLRNKMERLRLLRNRAAHHEPVHARDLTVDHRYMCELAGYVSPDLMTWVASHSRLPDVVANRVATVTGQRHTRF